MMYWIVALQAALTVVGNSTMAYSAYRVYQYEKDKVVIVTEEESSTANAKPLLESDIDVLVKTTSISLVIAAVVKYGELFLDIPFESNTVAALSLVILSTFYHGARLAVFSQNPEAKFAQVF